jgi:hypothetical protein
MYHKEKFFILISGLFILLASIGFGITLIIDHALNGKHDLINELQTKLDSANRDRRASNDRIIYARIFRNALDSFSQDRDDIELRKSRKKEFIADLRIAASLMFCAANELQEISDAELKSLASSCLATYRVLKAHGKSVEEIGKIIYDMCEALVDYPTFILRLIGRLKYGKVYK